MKFKVQHEVDYKTRDSLFIIILVYWQPSATFENIILHTEACCFAHYSLSILVNLTIMNRLAYISFLFEVEKVQGCVGRV